MRNAILLLVLAAVSAGCGYRGPLYLPKPKPDAHQPAPPVQEEKKPGA